MDRTIKKRYAASLFLMILAPVVLFPSHACAYIDPNTGGYVFQILFPVLSAIAGLFLFCRNFINSFLCGFSVYFAKNSLGELPGNTWTRLTNWKTKAYI
ncbi:MAG: hypothetical protein WCR46_13970 [Deltaproteobacteria bacterium]